MLLAAPRFRRLRTKLTVLYAGLFGLAMLGASLVLFTVVERNAMQQVRGELVAAGTVFDRLLAQRTAQLGGATSLLAHDFGFRAAVATGDARTVESALTNLRQRMVVPIAFVVGVDGKIAGLHEPVASDQAAALWQALDAGQTSGVVQLGGTARHVVAAPILAPTLTGWLVLATNLDASEMASLQRLSAIPIQASVFQRDAAGRWQVAGGSDAPEPGLSRFIDAARRADAPSDVTTARGESVALVKKLPGMAGTPDSVLLLRYPLALALAGYRQLQLAIALTAIAGLIGTIFATWRMAQSITRPVSMLDAAAERLAAGGDAQVPVDGDDELARLAGTFNRMAAGIAERERRITHLAFNDLLTGLPNRALLLEHLEHALRHRERNGGTLAVLCLDLANFKAVNDTLGLAVGDALLKAMGARISAACDGFVARLGGDEFALVVEAGADIERLAEALLGAVEAPLHVAGHDVTAGASIGIALAPGDGNDSATLLKNADLALHRAKEFGRHSYCFFEEALNQRAQVRRRIESDLRLALKHGQFEMFFQPLFDLRKNRIGSFEALLRWNHPERGSISPAEFIPVAEETGLIVEIGAWVLRESCRLAATWPEPIRVAVNVSSVQFRKPGLNDVVLQALVASGLQPARLELEITESIFLDGTDATLAVLHSLRSLGVRVALDDFGTGYSSLSYLQSFPFDKIKIDRSFIQHLLTRQGATAIVRAIIDLAHALGMETTAEGVEENDQLMALRRHGCTSVQGYLFSRPVAAAGVHALLDAEAPELRAVG